MGDLIYISIRIARGLTVYERRAGAVIGWRGQGIDGDMGDGCDWLVAWVGQTRLRARLWDVSEVEEGSFEDIEGSKYFEQNATSSGQSKS